MNYNEFVERIKQIKDMGFVESNRSGDTGIGKTLEDLLGISENNIAGPDFDIYELKSGRKDSCVYAYVIHEGTYAQGCKQESFGSIRV